MEYSVGRTGRIIAARLFEGEDIYECIENTAEKEGIKCAAVLITGGIRKAKVVVGPKTETPKIVPDFCSFTGPGEALGVGTLYLRDGKPSLHLHASIGKNGQFITGCPRGGAEVFLVLEVTIIEIEGVDAARQLDPQTGINLLRFR